MMQRLVTWLGSGDQRALYFLNRNMKCAFLDWLMYRITHLGGVNITVGFFLILIIFTFDQQEFWKLLSGNNVPMALEGFIALTTSHLLVQVLKRSLGRPRPYLRDARIHTVPDPLKDYSFPSGHTTAIFSLVTTVSLHYIWLALLFPVAVLVGLSRIYLGLHYPSDVMIGAGIGVLFSLMAHVL